MTWETTLKGNTWTHSQSGKGGRKELVKKGVWVLDHRPTGRFIIGTSNDVSKEIDKQLKQLEQGKFPHKLMQQLFDTPEGNKGERPAMVIVEYPLNSEKDIKRTLKEIRETNSTDYCLLAEVTNGNIPSGKEKPSKSMARK